jgi:enoyl-CoA hydratase/carnithine racemase
MDLILTGRTIDAAEALRIGGVDRASRQDQVHGDRAAHQPRQPLRAARAGDDAEPDLGLAELRGLRGEDQVAHHRPFAPAAQREAVDRGDDGQAGAGQLLPGRGDEVLAIGLAERLGGHLLDVRASGERLLARAGQDEAAQPRVGVKRPERGLEFARHLKVEGVQRFGPVHRHNRDAAVAFGADGGVVAHGLTAPVWRFRITRPPQAVKPRVGVMRV